MKNKIYNYTLLNFPKKGDTKYSFEATNFLDASDKAFLFLSKELFFFNNEEGTKYLGFSLKKENGRIVDFLGYPVPTGKRININNEWYNYRPVVSPFTDDMKKIYLRKNNGRNNRKSKSKNNTNQLKSK